MITNPKTFFEQFQNFIEESGLQLKKFKSNLSNYFTKSEAIDTFLGKTDQAESAKKATQDSEGNVISSTYLKTNTASTTYLTQANASSTYLTKTGKATSASTADTAGSANTATKATQDAKGNVIDSTYLTKTDASSSYLTKDGKAASATSADTATKASQDSSGNEITTTYLKKADAESTYLGKTAKAESAKSADAATKAIQDGDGNVISGTYLKSATAQTTYLSKTDAASTYLGKTAKAASATTADSATKATQDGSGNNIEQTYAKKTDIPSVPEVDTSALVMKDGNRGQLAGYETPLVSVNPVVITNDSPDSVQVTSDVGIIVERGETGTSWTKTVSITNASAFITLGDDWVWSGGMPPTITDNAILVLHWCNSVGVANLVEGATNANTFTGTIIHTGLVGWYTHIWRDGECIYTIGGGNATVTTECALAVGDTFSCDTKKTPSASTYAADPGDGVIAFSNMTGISIVNYEVTGVVNGFSVALELY